MFFEKRKKKIYALNALKRLEQKNIYVLDINIDLQTRNKIFVKSKSSKGYFSAYDNLIALNKTLEYNEIQRVMYHEYGHAIDLFIGLHEYFTEKEVHFYSERKNELMKGLKKSSLRSYFSKFHESKLVDYYMTNDEIFPELFSCYLIDDNMPKILKEFVEKYIELFNKHVDSYKDVNIVNSINLSYRDELPKLNDVLLIKNKVLNNKEKYEDLLVRFIS